MGKQKRNRPRSYDGETHIHDMNVGMDGAFSASIIPGTAEEAASMLFGDVACLVHEIACVNVEFPADLGGNPNERIYILRIKGTQFGCEHEHELDASFLIQEDHFDRLIEHVLEERERRAGRAH